MAGYGWSSRRGTGSGGQRRPQVPSQIACRVCDRVFMSTQALIDHIESHIGGDDLASKRRRLGLNLMSSSQNEPFPMNPFKFNLTSPTRLPEISRPLSLSGYNLPSLRERNPTLRPTPHNLVSLRRSVAAQSPLLDWNNNNTNIPQKQHLFMGEALVTDCTKPFLQQLDTPFFSRDVGFRKRSRSDADILDLTLKL
ncbi:hypothetical protein Tsubulata_001692 [Turnera subulata]|uniref:C2H2-type domain-containing protein n=1 Tax=Turnera subulata TaxID=218843 RepID=A0A9Q0FK67_9ROSI|nr:hypothetical protein Tsubulata_001692 [Turnera subulata]